MLPHFALLNNKINNMMDINNKTDTDTNTEEEIITSFTDINNNKQFVKSTTDVNKLIDGFIQYITDNPQKIADVLALDINIDKIKVINAFINTVKTNINKDNNLLISCLNKYVNVSQKLNNEIQNKINKILQIINTPTKYIDSIYADMFYANEKQILDKTIDAKQLVNNFFESINSFRVNRWIMFIRTYMNITMEFIDNNELNIIINELKNKLKQEITVPITQIYIDNFILSNTKFFNLVYKPGTYGHNKSDYTKFGKQLFNKVKEECDNYIQNNSEIQNALSLICNIKSGSGKNFYILQLLLNQVTIVVLSYIQNINLYWDKYDIKHFIRIALELLSPQIAKQFKSNDFSVMINQIMQVIKNNLDTLLPNVQFKKLPNGYYRYSWIDTHKNKRFDANELLRYIKNNKDVANSLIKQALNIDLSEFQQKYGIRWRQFINLLLSHPEALDKFHLLVRKYIVNLNRDIVLQKSNEVNNIKDDNKIISIDEQGNLIDTKGNLVNDNSKDKLILDFDPRNDEQRERPLVVFREYLSDDRNDYKDHIKIGRRGENHGSVINRNKKLVEKSVFPGDDNPTFAYAYVIGKICVIDNNRGMFPSVAAVKDAIKQSGKFSKIYIMPSNDPILFRLARKI